MRTSLPTRRGLELLRENRPGHMPLSRRRPCVSLGTRSSSSSLSMSVSLSLGSARLPSILADKRGDGAWTLENDKRRLVNDTLLHWPSLTGVLPSQAQPDSVASIVESALSDKLETLRLQLTFWRPASSSAKLSRTLRGRMPCAFPLSCRARRAGRACKFAASSGFLPSSCDVIFTAARRCAASCKFLRFPWSSPSSPA